LKPTTESLLRPFASHPPSNNVTIFHNENRRLGTVIHIESRPPHIIPLPTTLPCAPLGIEREHEIRRAL